MAPVRPADTVSDVLARSESLVEVFVRHAPHFAKLRNRAMRRVMARLITVEQAARTAHVPTERLLQDLNDALGIPTSAADIDHVPAAPADGSAPCPVTHPTEASVVELDVRAGLRLGREPFATIMAAVGALRDGDVLLLHTSFEPVPLFDVLAKRGFSHESREDAPDDWHAWFWRPAGPEGVLAASTPSAVTFVYSAADDTTSWLDVRGLEPPGPLVRTLAALDTLPHGHVLVQVNNRVPQMLFPMLAERGFACEVDESRADAVSVRIWRRR
jgi:TusA-related sulfurtransferase